MKKIFKQSFTMFLTVVMVISAVPLSGIVGLNLPNLKELFSTKAEATEYIDGYFTYTYIGGNNEVQIDEVDTSITGNIVIPSTYDKYTVTRIASGAFRNCINITSVVIPDSITDVRDSAFQSCTSLKSVTIGNGITTISKNMFAYCENLSNVIIPKSITIIESHAFEGCNKLESIIVPESVISIGAWAFSHCNSLNNISLPDGLKEICSSSFQHTGYYNNQSNWINGVLYIDNHLLEANDSISDTYNVKNGTKSIAEGAFYGCKNLNNISLPEGLEIIGGSSFAECDLLNNINIPNTVVDIGHSAFFGCNNLIFVTIPDSVTCIGYWAFKNCTNLESVHIPPTISKIGYHPNKIFNILENTSAYICSSTGDCYAKSYAEQFGIDFIKCNGSHAIEGGEETPIVDKLLLESTYPINNATSLSYDDELVLTFNQNLHEDLYILDPNSAIKICDYNTDAVIYSIDYDDYGVTGFRDSPVVIEENILTIRNALHKLVPGSKYYITISPNIILSQPDSDGNRKAFAGITDKETWTFSYLSPSVKERYSLDVYFTKPNVVLSAGKNASISAVLSFNGEITFPEMTFSIDDTNVAEITEIKTESNITYATIKGKKQGSTTITVSANTVDGNIVKKFPVFVSDPETVYYCNYIDGRFNNSNPFYLSGMYEESGMYIDDFKHTKNDDGSVNAVFTVYNFEHCYGTVDVYDENGNLVDYEVIDMYIGEYQTDIFSHIGYTWELTEGVVTGEMFDRNDYKSEVWCKKTEISIVVPQNGYYVISNNISTSKACLAYNISTLLVEMLLKSNNFIDKLTDILSKKDLLSIIANSEKIAKAFSEEFLSELIKNGSDKVTDDLIEALIEFSVESQAKSAAGVEKVFDSFEDCLNELGLNVFETVKKSIVKVLKTSITETALNVLFDLNLKRCGKDIVDMIYYNAVTISKWLTTAGSIQEHTDSSSVYVYNQQNNSMRKSNGIVSYTTENYDTVFHTVILKSGDKVDYVNRLTGEQEKAKVYDISLIRDGESVQPKDSVTVYIPIPNGWITDNLTLYHISKETGKREKIPVEIENGYAKFVTDSFSYFILSTDELKFVDTFEIKTPSTTTISYGDTLILHAVVESVPNGTNIAWKVSGNGVSIKPSEDGLSCAVTSTKTGTVSINAKLIDESGEVLKNFDSEELTASQSIKSNAGFFQKIIAFFKKLFGLTKTIPQIYNGIF